MNVFANLPGSSGTVPKPVRFGKRNNEAVTLEKLLRWERDGRRIRDFTFIGTFALVDLLLVYLVVTGQKSLEAAEPGFIVAGTLLAVSIACATAVVRLERKCMRSLQSAQGVAAVGSLIGLLEADDPRVYRAAAGMAARMLPRLSDQGLAEITPRDRSILVRELETTSPESQADLLVAALGVFARLKEPAAAPAARALLTGPPTSRRDARVRGAARDYLGVVERIERQPGATEGGTP